MLLNNPQPFYADCRCTWLVHHSGLTIKKKKKKKLTRLQLPTVFSFHLRSSVHFTPLMWCTSHCMQAIHTAGGHTCSRPAGSDSGWKVCCLPYRWCWFLANRVILFSFFCFFTSKQMKRKEKLLRWKRSYLQSGDCYTDVLRVRVKEIEIERESERGRSEKPSLEFECSSDSGCAQCTALFHEHIEW